jgi:hypothetical protein
MIVWRFQLLFLVLFFRTVTIEAFLIGNRSPSLKFESALKDTDSDVVELAIGMPPSGSGWQANMRIQPILSVPSEFVEVRYKVPFGLNVAPKNQLCVCTKDGPGGEKEGDVLRYTSQWTLGFPSGDGLLTSAASFSGGVSWQCSLFNVVKARSWEEVVKALTSNVEVSA